ncbi:hypothetical protein TrVE_jg10809, partial [Triparma verrucosa]
VTYTELSSRSPQTSSSCKPYVKYSEAADEEFVELVEIDGVEAECALNFMMSEKYIKDSEKDENDYNYNY